MPLLRQQDAVQAENYINKSKGKMSYRASIEVEGNTDHLDKIFLAEKFDKEERSSFSVEKQKSGLKFIVEANDSTALRATLNSITKLLGVYEKMRNIN